MYCILRNIQVLAIQEHKIIIKDSDELLIRRILYFGWQFIFLSATITSDIIPFGDVGFILSPTAYNNRCAISKMSDMILLILFGLYSNFKADVISFLSTTFVSSIDDVEQFYSYWYYSSCW